MFEYIGVIVGLEHNEITFTWLLFFVFTLYSFRYFNDFLLLGSRSLCTKMLIHGQTAPPAPHIRHYDWNGAMQPMVSKMLGADGVTAGSARMMKESGTITTSAG